MARNRTPVIFRTPVHTSINSVKPKVRKPERDSVVPKAPRRAAPRPS